LCRTHGRSVEALLLGVRTDRCIEDRTITKGN
jgi:hypothetical protein